MCIRVIHATSGIPRPDQDQVRFVIKIVNVYIILCWEVVCWKKVSCLGNNLAFSQSVLSQIKNWNMIWVAMNELHETGGLDNLKCNISTMCAISTMHAIKCHAGNQITIDWLRNDKFIQLSAIRWGFFYISIEFWWKLIA